MGHRRRHKDNRIRSKQHQPLGDWVQTAARSEGNTGVGIRITVSEVSSISLWLGVGRSLAVSYGGVRVSSIGQGGSGTGDSLVGSIDTGGGLASEGVKPVSIRIAVSGVDDGWVSLGHSGSNKGTGNNKEFHG